MFRIFRRNCINVNEQNIYRIRGRPENPVKILLKLVTIFIPTTLIIGIEQSESCFKIKKQVWMPRSPIIKLSWKEIMCSQARKQLFLGSLEMLYFHRYRLQKLKFIFLSLSQTQSYRIPDIYFFPGKINTFIYFMSFNFPKLLNL